jgi:hypothetical protein
MFSGDAVQWSIPTITRQNLSAWLVCGKQSLWINLGAYLYMTPAGCADQTVSQPFFCQIYKCHGLNIWKKKWSLKSSL